MKNKNIIKSFGLILLVIIIIFLLDTGREKPVDWSYSYSCRDKIPYGTFVLYDLLPELFHGNEIFMTQQSPFSILKTGVGEPCNYIIINEKFDPGPASLKALLSFVARGNRLFLAAEHLNRQFCDTLGIKLEVKQSFSDNCFITFYNDTSGVDSVYRLRQGDGLFSLSFEDSSKASVIAVNNHDRPCFIALSYGTGTIFVSSVPAIFCNYYILYGSTGDFVFRALSCMPVSKVIWDEYYKVANVEVQSPLRFILSTESLKWAYYLFIASIILFILFNGRRRQRAIPVFRRPVNKTIAFIQTIARLYLKTGNHKIVARKKIAHLLAFLRNRYRIKSIPREEQDLIAMAQRTSIPQDLLTGLSQLVIELNGRAVITNSRLIYINQFVDAFYEKVKR